MAYQKTTWANGQAPAIDAEHLNKIEQGVADCDAKALFAGITIPAKTVTVAASEVQDYLTALPKLMTERLTINVTGDAGTVIGPNLFIVGFCGPGGIKIVGSKTGTSNNITISGEIICDYGTCPITLSNFELVATGETLMPGLTNGCIHCFWGGNVILNECNITGNGKCCGVIAYSGGSISVQWSAIKNCAIAARASINSVVSILAYAAHAAGFTGNTVGASSERGSIIGLSDAAPDLLGGSSNTKNGGLIVKADGTLL